MKSKEECRKMTEELIQNVCSTAGCDRPDNIDAIIEYIVNDVEETADPVDWHSGDIGIAFRRFMESKSDF